MKNISIIFLFFSTLLLVYIFYLSVIGSSGTRRAYFLSYYYISFIFLTLSIISFFVSKETKYRIILLLVFTILGLYIVEFFLQKTIFSFKKKVNESNIRYDNRTLEEVHYDEKQSGNDVAIVISLEKFLRNEDTELRPLAGISNRKTIHCNENGYYSIYESDQYGFNNPNSEWNKEKIEILLIGDSFAHGNCVNEPNTIGGNLRKKVKNKGVLNLGQEGSGPLIEYATLREYFFLNNAKRVIWVYFKNDLADLKLELTDNTLINYLNDQSYSQNLHLRQKEIDNLLEKKILEAHLSNLDVGFILRSKFYFKRFIKLTNVRIVTIEAFFRNYENLDSFSQIVNLSRNLVQKNDESKFYFVYVPEALRYSVSTMKSGRFQNYENVISAVKKLNIPIIDLHKELFKNHNNPLSLFSGEGHYNELGYKLIADTILKKITDYENNDKALDLISLNF